MCARSFRDAPHIEYFFVDERRRDRDAEALFRMRLRYGLLYGEVYATSEQLEGISMWLPSKHASFTMWREIRAGGTRLYRAVGADAVARMTQVSKHNECLRTQSVATPHWFLSLIAVDPDHQRQGHASHLLVPRLRRLDRDPLSCYAETTDRTVLSFYDRLGFDVGEPSVVPGTELAVWPLLRPPANELFSKPTDEAGRFTAAPAPPAKHPELP